VDQVDPIDQERAPPPGQAVSDHRLDQSSFAGARGLCEDDAAMGLEGSVQLRFVAELVGPEGEGQNNTP